MCSLFFWLSKNKRMMISAVHCCSKVIIVAACPKEYWEGLWSFLQKNSDQHRKSQFKNDVFCACGGVRVTRNQVTTSSNSSFSITAQYLVAHFRCDFHFFYSSEVIWLLKLFRGEHSTIWVFAFEQFATTHKSINQQLPTSSNSSVSLTAQYFVSH